MGLAFNSRREATDGNIIQYKGKLIVLAVNRFAGALQKPCGVRLSLLKKVNNAC